MLVKVHSALYKGLQTIGIDVEVNVANRGLPAFDIVGLASKAVSESKERVRTAFINAGIEFPRNKITVNLAPGDVPKEGSFFDLPIAIGILSATGGYTIPKKSLFFGELSLDGTLRHAKGALLFALYAKEKGFTEIFVPETSANEAAVVDGIVVYPVRNLDDCLSHLLGEEKLQPVVYQEEDSFSEPEKVEFDFSEVRGQEQAKRALEIAAAGGHNFLMVGSPGAGKTMLARALPGILPELNDKESLEVTKIYSVSGLLPPESSLVRMRPFRSPHHTISSVGLIGGGSKPQPGEITLAHRGVLFLDEFNEFPRTAVEAMRQPLEDGNLTISRSQERVNYPARFMLVASANPCPCGYLYDPKKTCICTERERQRYHKRISGPILDRIDLHVDVPVVDVEDLDMQIPIESENSDNIRTRVERARDVQLERFTKEDVHTNSEMKNRHIKKHCTLSKEVRELLHKGAKQFELSARAYFKVIKVARTIADLSGSESIELNHMAESLQYRPKIAETE